METIADELSRDTYLPLGVMGLRLGLALICGAIVGLEREWHQRAAGFRTHILICLSAATLAIAAVEMTHLQTFSSDRTRIDPLRLIESLTSGVAFLAAGTIVFSRGEVRGLTTGAGMWLAGTIGLAAGLGFWQLAGLSTVFALLVLWLLRRFEHHLGRDEKKEEDERQGRQH